jgi:hypothetical protein
MVQVEGNINSVEKQLLYDILNELKVLREDLKSIDTNIPFNEETPLTIDYTSMKRPELMKLVSELDNKPQGWTKFSNVKLIELLKEG